MCPGIEIANHKYDYSVGTPLMSKYTILMVNMMAENLVNYMYQTKREISNDRVHTYLWQYWPDPEIVYMRTLVLY